MGFVSHGRNHTKGVKNDTSSFLASSCSVVVYLLLNGAPRGLGDLGSMSTSTSISTSTCRHLRRGKVTVHLYSVRCSDIVLKNGCKCISTVPYKTDVILHHKNSLTTNMFLHFTRSNPFIHRMAQVERVGLSI